MSDSTTNARVNLLINGQQAEETLTNLRKHALDLQSQIAKAAVEGDKLTLSKLRKELKETNRQIKEMESATQQVDNVLRQLDSATPRELQKTLHTLNKQLDYMERGSDVWNAQVRKIRLVKDEIARVNGELMKSQSLLERFNNKWQEWQTVAMGAVAAATGAVMAGKAAVQAYADMEAEMANVRKFTGMTADEVELLNQEFRKIDTRTGRDELNKLAQEAGRLGKTSQEDVLGFVKAADQINVALDDLGAGATLTLSKLTSIFGDEERLGTERSLLAVGSVINELSQNCTASAPYLAQFAQRLAGVGAQADMTIPQIMGFAAVLDSQGQAVEMSATAMSQVIMNMFKETDKICAATGMNLNEFNAALKRSTNEGLMMLLDQLHNLGGIDVLAPVFKDMGENGARASSVISALAANIDMVKWEQEEATKAFEEATSVTNEFNVQNNTAQAGLDKARKGFTEMAVALGQELLPVMRHVISTTSMTMKAMLQTIKFVKDHRGAIVTLTSAIVAYTVAVKAADVAQKLYSGAVKTATAIQKAFNLAIKQNPLGLIAAAVAAAIAALVAYRRLLKQVAAEHDVVGQAEKEASKEYAASKGKVEQLSAAVHNNALSLNYRKKALAELQSIVPSYHASLTEEGKLINDNTTAIEQYLQALQRKLQYQAYEDKLAEQYTKRAKKELELDEAKMDAQNKQNEYIEYSRTHSDFDAAGNRKVSFRKTHLFNESRRADDEVKELQGELDKIDEQITKLSEKIGKQDIVVPVKLEPQTDDDTPITLPQPDDSKPAKNKFQAEDDWKEREQALNRISYAKGEEDFDAYTKRMLAIEVEYNKKKLEHTDLEGNEEVTIQAAYEEAKFKQRQNTIEGTIEQENEENDRLMAILQQRYVDGELSARQYQEAIELQELQHLQNVAKLYDEGSKERLKAEKTYHDTSLRYQQKHLQEAKQMQEKMREQYFTRAYTVPDQESYNRDMQNLELVHKQMLAAVGNSAKDRLKVEQAFLEAKYQLARKYNVKEAKEMENSFRNAIDDSIEWLNSDAGKAFTDSFSLITEQMGAIFSGLSDLVQAELDIQTARIEDRYNVAVSAAEGNKYKEVQLEKEKQAQLAAAKKDANKKMFAMQVIQAIAQTATSAIAAYSSAAAIPMIGWAMAPAAAAMAVAAGGIQIAAIKKQQQASESQGYQEGGFTKPGRKDEPAGIVHAGEWVASKELLANPTARAMINILDEAQRTNTIGKLSASDVSSSITAPVQIASAQSSGELMQVAVAAASLGQTVNRLTDRLEEPFVTVNTVSGDAGIKQAQDEYNQLIRNKTPKSRRS